MVQADVKIATVQEKDHTENVYGVMVLVVVTVAMVKEVLMLLNNID